MGELPSHADLLDFLAADFRDGGGDVKKLFRLLVENRDATPEEFESYALNREKVVAPGSTAIIYVGPLSAGRYEYFGDFNPTSERTEGPCRVSTLGGRLDPPDAAPERDRPVSAGVVTFTGSSGAPIALTPDVLGNYEGFFESHSRWSAGVLLAKPRPAK